MFVCKVKYEDSLRRITFESSSEINMASLVSQIRSLFEIPETQKLWLTYTDRENDIVTMTEDMELYDACVRQDINPLRIEVKQAPSKSEVPAKFLEAAVKSLPSDSVKQLLQRLEPLGLSQSVLSEMVQNLTKFVTNVEKTQQPQQQQQQQQQHSYSFPSGERVFHDKVQCDGCGLSPIVGPRFKSKTKIDFDLCLSCFNEFGNEAEYVRYDRPVQLPGRFHSWTSGCPALRSVNFRPVTAPSTPSTVSTPGTPTLKTVGVGGCLATAGTLLDCQFVEDVTIPDGTELTPLTPFVKTWRLRNSGSVPWPSNMLLVHAGGNVLSSVSCVEVSREGVACGKEMDVSVHLKSPSEPGRYREYFRLMAPSGSKFGHRLWVLIHVTPNVIDCEMEEMKCAEEKGKEEEEKGKGKEEEEGKGKEEEEEKEEKKGEEKWEWEREWKWEGEGEGEEKDEEKGEEERGGGVVVVEMNKEEMEMEVEVEVESENGSKEVMGFSMVEMVDVENKEKVDDIEKQLQSMGFSDEKLNLELLEKNGNDLERTLDDLVASADWDPFLEELEEMGFNDTDVNRRLMFKNNGSIKRVVKELVLMYKENK